MYDRDDPDAWMARLSDMDRQRVRHYRIHMNPQCGICSNGHQIFKQHHDKEK